MSSAVLPIRHEVASLLSLDKCLAAVEEASRLQGERQDAGPQHHGDLASIEISEPPGDIGACL